jgi:preprotein translocase subunit SecB
MSDQASNGAVAPAQPTGPQFTVEKIYVKDVSFESPKAPAIFAESAQPQLNMNLNQRVQRVNENVFEVVLGVTLTCTAGEGDGSAVYVVEVQQAGLFGMVGFEDATIDALLGTQCPNVLFPYARQLISDLIQAGGFAPFLLQPINFDGLYAETLRQRQQQAAQGGDLANSETAGNA